MMDLILTLFNTYAVQINADMNLWPGKTLEN